MLTVASLRQVAAGHGAGGPWRRCAVGGAVAGLLVAEAVDRRLEAGALLRVGHAEARLGRERQHADLALVGVPVDVEGRLADLLERVGLAERRVDEAAV